MMTAGELDGIVPAHLVRAARDVRIAGVQQHDGSSVLGAQVVQPSDDAPCPQSAERVLAVTGLSFDTAHWHMRAAATTLWTFAIELAVAQLALRTARDEAARHGVHLDDEGCVRDPSAAASACRAAARCSELAKLALARAIAADVACSTTLGESARGRLPLSVGVDVTTVAYASRCVVEARAAANRAGQLLTELRNAAARDAESRFELTAADDDVASVLDAYWRGGTDTDPLLDLAEQDASSEGLSRAEVARHLNRFPDLADLTAMLFGDTSPS